jgi:hypothetical protein
MDESSSTVQALLVYLLTGGGAGLVAWKVVDWLPWTKDLVADLKRNAAYAVTSVVALIAWGLGIWFGQIEVPTGGVGFWEISAQWVQSAGGAIVVALGLNQWIHGQLTLRPQRLKAEAEAK